MSIQESTIQLKTIQFLSTAVCSAIAETSTFPLDMIKTRIQMQGDAVRLKKSNHEHLSMERKNFGKSGYRQMSTICPDTGKTIMHEGWAHVEQAIGITKNQIKSGSMKYKNKPVTKIIGNVYKKRGFAGFYTGLQPAIIRHCVYSGSRMTLYETARDYFLEKNRQKGLVRSTNRKDGKKVTANLTFAQSAFLAGTCGSLGQLIANPLDLAKVRMQSGEAKSLLQVYRATPNFKSFYAGAAPNLSRAFFVNQGDLMTYDRLKQGLLDTGYLEEGALLYTLCSLGSGIVSCLLATPFDTIKTRTMNQPRNSKGKGLYYNKGMLQAATTIVKNEGFISLYRGYFFALPRMVIWSQVFWHMNENLRSIFGMKPF